MLGDITTAKDIYIACGYTDMSKSIDGLPTIIQEQFHLDPFSKSLYLFCGKRRDRLKALLWEGDGFILLYKRLGNGNFKWLLNDKLPAAETTHYFSERNGIQRQNIIGATSNKRVNNTITSP